MPTSEEGSTGRCESFELLEDSMKILAAIGLLILAAVGLALFGLSPLHLALFLVVGLGVLCLAALFRRRTPSVKTPE
jgi:hypothetical protein